MGEKRPYRLDPALKEARELGNKTYFTGKPCKRGHISERLVSSRGCVVCAKEIHYPKSRDSYRNPENTFKKQFYSRKQVANRLGIPFTIEFEDLDQPTFCPILGVRLNYGCSTGQDGNQSRDPNKASIDKLDPLLGYIPGNVYVISRRANKLKSDMSVEELEKILDYMKKGNYGKGD